VQELQGEENLGRVEPRSVDVELGALLDVEHQVAAVQVLHREEQVGLEPGLKGSIYKSFSLASCPAISRAFLIENWLFGPIIIK